MAFLECKRLSFSYDGAKILHNINLNIKRKEIFGILGPNGSGKSTLVRLISDFLSPDSGQIFLAGKNIASYAQEELTTRLAVLAQQPQVNFDFTVREIVSMGRKPYLKRWQGLTSADEEKINEALKVTKTYQFAERKINSLSGGERQRVFLAQTLAQDPDVLLLDEPTSGLDINYQLEIFNLIQELKEEGLTIVVVMHDLNLAAQYCDRLALLNQQQIKKVGSPKEVITVDNIKNVYGCEIEVKHNKDSRPYIKYIS